MNSILKILALCCFFIASVGLSGQAFTASVSSNGLLQVNEALPWQDQYSFDISRFNFHSESEARNFFTNYIVKFNDLGEFSFDLVSKRGYLRAKKDNGIHVNSLTPKLLNEGLKLMFN